MEMDSDPLSLPSTGKPTIVNITGPESRPTNINIPSGPVKTSSSSPSSPQTPSGTTSGVVQHTFYKPRATSIASARRSRAESLTNSLGGGGSNNVAAANVANATVAGTGGPSLSRPPSFSRSRPPSASYIPGTTVTPSASFTHTGGILPPASFFHPKQPPIGHPMGPGYQDRPPPLNANNVYAPPRTRTYSASGGNTMFIHHGPGGRPSSGI